MNPQRSRRALKRVARRREAFARHLVSVDEARGAERETADNAGKATDVPKISETRDDAATHVAKQAATPIVERKKVEESAPPARPSRSSRRRRKRRSRRNVRPERANASAVSRPTNNGAPEASPTTTGTPAASPPVPDPGPNECAPVPDPEPSECAPVPDPEPSECAPSADPEPLLLQSPALAELGIVAIHSAPRRKSRRGESRFVLREVFE